MNTRQYLYQKLPKKYRKRISRLLGVPNVGKFRISLNKKNYFLHDAGKSSILRDIYINGFIESDFEPEVSSLIQYLVPNSHSFFDVGANVGFFSYLAASINGDVKVYAFEPVPKNYQYIQNTVSGNNLQECITVEPIALSNTSGKLDFYVPRSDTRYPATASLINRFEGKDATFIDTQYNKITVKSQTFDEYINLHNITFVDLIKVDVEEAELAFLLGAQRCLSSLKPDVILEILINTPDKLDIYNYMRNLGYNSYLITNGGLVREDKPLTLPKPNAANRTLWPNHYFSCKSKSEIESLSQNIWGRYIG